MCVPPVWLTPRGARRLTPRTQFQAGVSNYLLQRFDFALRDFEEALLYLRSNQDMCAPLSFARLRARPPRG